MGYLKPNVKSKTRFSKKIIVKCGKYAIARTIAIGLSILLLAYEIFEYIHMTGTALWAQSEEKKKETYSYLVRMRIFFYINVPFAFGATYVSGNIKIMFNIITGIALVYCVIYYVKLMISK